MPTAALFRLEGTLSPVPTLAAAAWLAANAQRMRQRLLRLGASALAAPLLLDGPLQDRQLAHRLAWGGLRGVSEDRVAVLGAEFAAERVLPRLRPAGRRLVDEARRQGFRVVLLSDTLHEIASPVAEEVGADELVCNRLEMRDGRATGRLIDPVQGPHVDGRWLREWAAEHDVDLARSRAYGARADDGVLLGAVGEPCTVHPDRKLRRMARDLSWPIVEA